jgi:sugar lactone lactonase YvrE
MGSTVKFLSGGPVAIGTAAISSGVARLTANALPTGTDVITAVYSGDSTYAPATSNAMVETINRLAPKVQAIPSSSSAFTSQAFSLAVAVTGPSGAAAPTGSVTVTSGTYAANSVALGNAGTATINIPAWALGSGSDSLTVTYTPDAASMPTYVSATGSAAVAVANVTPIMTATLSSSTITTAQSLAVSVTVTAPASGTTPTGTVSLVSGKYSSAASALSNGNATIGIPPFSLQAGVDPLTINYTPDAPSAAKYNSASRNTSLTATKVAPAVAVAPAATNVLISQGISVAVAVSSLAGYAVPTGNVTLSSGSYSHSAMLNSGMGVINIPAGSLPSGNNILSVTYTPDAASSSGFASAVGASSVTVSNSLRQATAVYSGTTSGGQNFGSVAIGTTSAVRAYTFSLAAGTTVGSIGVLTMGAANMDFANAQGSTCTARTYATQTSCTVNLTFTPAAAGARVGAVVLFSNAGNSGTVLATLPVYGVGSGAQIAFASNAATIITPEANGVGLNAADALALDGRGDVYIADSLNNRVVEMPAASGQGIAIAPIVNGLALKAPSGLAVDGAGNLFIADGNNRVAMVPPGGATATVIDPIVNGAGLNGPTGLAVDGLGDLFIADSNNNRVIEIPANGDVAMALAPVVNGMGLSSPAGLTLDGTGNLFIADSGNGRVVKLVLASGATSAMIPTVKGALLPSPVSVAVDGAGDLFVTGSGLNVVEVPVSGSAAFYPLPAAPAVPSAIAADGAGDLFVSLQNSGSLLIYRRSLPPTLRYPAATPVGLVDTADGAQAAQMVNVGNAPLALSALGFPADFATATGDAAACTASTVLSTGQQCDIAAKFAPEHNGALSESVTIAGSSNGIPIRQSISLSGVGLADQAAVITSPAAGSLLTGSNVTFTWTGAVGVTGYQLLIGTWGAGAGNIYNSYQISSTSMTVTVPTSGVKLFVRLNQEMNGIWQSADYTYTEAGTLVPGVINNPAPGSAVKGPNVTLSWAGASGPSEYTLCASIKSAGACDVYNSGVLTTTSATVTVPAGGVTLYVKLAQLISGTWSAANYKYTVQ